MRVRANGIEFVVREWGRGDRLALLLHGFPDDADSMAPLAARLSAAGYRCVAPFMRGYAPSGPGRDYGLASLGDDVGGLVTALGHADALVVGHDWGALATYAALRRHPARVRVAVTLSVPPVPAFLRNLRGAQLRRSEYIGRFQLPGAARRIRRGGFAEIDRIWRVWSPGWTPPAGRVDAVKARLATPGCIEAAVAYYLGFRRSRVRDFGALVPRPGRLLVLAGRSDGCIGPEMYRGVAEARIIEGGHFLPLESTDEVADAVIRFAYAASEQNGDRG